MTDEKCVRARLGPDIGRPCNLFGGRYEEYMEMKNIVGELQPVPDEKESLRDINETLKEVAQQLKSINEHLANIATELRSKNYE